MMAPQDGECFPGTRFTIGDPSDENVRLGQQRIANWTSMKLPY
jgi:hypothetical protein